MTVYTANGRIYGLSPTVLHCLSHEIRLYRGIVWAFILTKNTFDTMVFNMEVDVYVKCKFIINYYTQKLYYLVLGQCTKVLKYKPKQSSGWS